MSTIWDNNLHDTANTSQIKKVKSKNIVYIDCLQKKDNIMMGYNEENTISGANYDENIIFKDIISDISKWK